MNADNRPAPKFKVGDQVIVTKGLYQSVFGYNDYMEAHIGKQTQITDAIWYKPVGAWDYSIECDTGGWSWCENCFEQVNPLPDFEAAKLDQVLEMLLQ